MEAREEQVAHLERLVNVLDPHAFAVNVVGVSSRLWLKVANASRPRLKERVCCGQAEDGSFADRARQPGNGRRLACLRAVTG
jgi:hypothetical protein